MASKGALLIAGAIVVAGGLIGAGLYFGQRQAEAPSASTAHSESASPSVTAPQTGTSPAAGTPIEPLPLDLNAAAEELARRYGQVYCGDPYINGHNLPDGLGMVFVPECLDVVDDPLAAELAVWNNTEGVVVMQGGDPSCSVNIEATTQEELCDE